MTDKTFDIMLDLETMGTGPNAAIVAIGAVDDAESQARHLIAMLGGQAQ